MRNTVDAIKKTTQKQIVKGIQKTRELKFYLYQFIVALIMGGISILILYKNPAEQFLKSCKSLAVLHR